MNEERHSLIAFLSVLLAIVVLFLASAGLAAYGRSVEAIGIGGVMTGLIGVLGSFRPKAASDQVIKDVIAKNPPVDGQ